MNFRYAVIDDAPFICELIKNILKGTGAIFVGEAHNGTDGFHLFQKTLPDILILDMVMPQENGIELARRIREVSHEVVIIACSTLDDDLIVQNAKDVGCDDYVTKPFTKESFLEVVKRNVEKPVEKFR
jgi:two-component system chemotaxis response regulator CheY